MILKKAPSFLNEAADSNDHTLLHIAATNNWAELLVNLLKEVSVANVHSGVFRGASAFLQDSSFCGVCMVTGAVSDVSVSFVYSGISSLLAISLHCVATDPPRL